MNLLFKARAHLGKIAGELSILRQTGLFSLFYELGKLFLLRNLKLLLSCKDVHGKLLEVVQVDIVKLVEHCNILQKRDLMTLQSGAYS